MNEQDPLHLLQSIPAPGAAPNARAEAIARAMAEFDRAKKTSPAAQGWGRGWRLIFGAYETWRLSMTSKSLAGPALATLLLVPVAGLATYEYLNSGTPQASDSRPQEKPESKQPSPQDEVADAARRLAESEALVAALQPEPAAAPPVVSAAEIAKALSPQASGRTNTRSFVQGGRVARLTAPSPEPAPRQAENRDRLESFSTNPVKRVAEEPVSTFSIDVDTASYAFVRRTLRQGEMPGPQSVRVEEMINYFPYHWPAPESATTPFRPTITVMPTPWNANTRLMHVAIKGYEIAQAEKPKSNLVFLVDTSGSMQDQDKLPLLKASLKLLLDKLGPDDTVGLVAYAGEAGVALKPTRVSDRAAILAAIDGLGAGGSTAGAEGIEEAYRLAQGAFVKGGVNRVMLATDGDFNVGPSDDEALKKLIQEKRASGVFLSVLGFGQGNYNDQMMQVLAQNGNGAAAYIDTLAEAEKTLVQEAASTLFPIAKDVKIQVEFNPDRVAEYRLIGYETRALKREDFNNDRVDAGDIGSGHSVTAIYEVTPKDSPAQSVDALRYAKPAPDAKPASAGEGELAFVKIRYKRPDADTSELIEQPVGEADAVATLDAAPQDVRFSVAVAAFGQKLRDADATAGFGYEAIASMAGAARGEDPFGYRSEFLTLVRLASSLDTRGK